MKAIDLITLILLIVGGLNWGLAGLFNWDLVAAIFGAGNIIARIVYILVGLSAVWQLVLWKGVHARLSSPSGTPIPKSTEQPVS